MMIFKAGRSVARLRAQCSGGSIWPSSTTERAPVLHKLLSSGDVGTFFGKPILTTPILRRFYADQPVSRPKAHTGRATNALKKAPATTSAKAAGNKKSTTNKAPKTRSKAKPRSKTKSKPKKRVKAKAKAKPKRKILTEAQKASKAKRDRREKIKDLKKKALLETPKATSLSAYKVFLAEQFSGKSKDVKPTDFIKEVAGRWKNVTPEQLEHLNHVAVQRTAANKATSVNRIESYTPEQIREANNARRRLSKLQKVDNPKRHPYSRIKDDRLVRKNKSSYNLFYSARYQSGDFKGLKVGESAALASREWKALSAAEKKPYEDAALQDKQRYEEEKKTVYKK